MHKTNALYLKTQRLIAETQRDTHEKRHNHRERDTHEKRHKQRERHTHRDTYKELLQRFTLHFSTHMNLNILLLWENSNKVPTSFI